MPTGTLARVRIRFWGTRGTCPSPGPRTVRYGGNTPCVEVRATDGPVIILDAGSGIRLLGQQLMAAEEREPLHLFLSHRHSDHVLGLAHFAPLLTQSRTITICCGDGEIASLPGFVSSLLSPPMFPHIDGLGKDLSVCEWPPGDVQRVGTFCVRRFTARHPGDAAVFRVNDATGPLVAYAPDNELAYADTRAEVTAWRARFVEFLRGVPVLIHDATYTAEELPRYTGWGHSSCEECVRLAMECEAGTLVLFHHHPDRDDEQIERIMERAREQIVKAGSKLRVLAAWEGLGLTL